MKFNSQICTTRSQSEALLKLGLKKETADMYYSYDIICAKPYYKVMEFMNGCVPEDIFPAWSLHRLAFLLDASPYPIYLDSNAYNDIIDDIEELINHNEFNKEYLEERK